MIFDMTEFTPDQQALGTFEGKEQNSALENATGDGWRSTYQQAVKLAQFSELKDNDVRMNEKAPALKVCDVLSIDKIR